LGSLYILMPPLFPVSDVVLLELGCAVNEADRFAVPELALPGSVVFWTEEALLVAALVGPLVLLARRCGGVVPVSSFRLPGFACGGEGFPNSVLRAGLDKLGFVADFGFGVVEARFSAVLSG
jgi:hypothetical protein